MRILSPCLCRSRWEKPLSHVMSKLDVETRCPAGLFLKTTSVCELSANFLRMKNEPLDGQGMRFDLMCGKTSIHGLDISLSTIITLLRVVLFSLSQALTRERILLINFFFELILHGWFIEK